MECRHGHKMGGGNYWLLGYQKMLSEIEQKKKKDSMIITESTAEIYMDQISAYLSLNAFMTCNPIGAFPAVYGGYYIPVGRIFYPTDLTEAEGIGFSLKIGQVMIKNNLLIGRCLCMELN